MPLPPRYIRLPPASRYADRFPYICRDQYSGWVPMTRHLYCAASQPSLLKSMSEYRSGSNPALASQPRIHSSPRVRWKSVHGPAPGFGRWKLTLALPEYLETPPHPLYASHVLTLASTARFDRSAGAGFTTKLTSNEFRSVSEHVIE